MFSEIGDGPAAGESVVGGVDGDTVTPENFEIRLAIDASIEMPTAYTTAKNTPASGGPAGNKWACTVTPTSLLYTTPTTPYDIRYKLVMQQKTQVIESPDGKMVEVRTVMDRLLNPWDMDPLQAGRQTKATWNFGVDTGGTHRTRQEVYE